MLPLWLRPEKQVFFRVPPQSQACYQGQGRRQTVWRICLKESEKISHLKIM